MGSGNRDYGSSGLFAVDERHPGGESAPVLMTAKDAPGFHTTVRRDPNLKRGHPNLFNKLARYLRENNATAPPEDMNDA